MKAQQSISSALVTMTTEEREDPFSTNTSTIDNQTSAAAFAAAMLEKEEGMMQEMVEGAAKEDASAVGESPMHQSNKFDGKDHSNQAKEDDADKKEAKILSKDTSGIVIRSPGKQKCKADELDVIITELEDVMRGSSGDTVAAASSLAKKDGNIDGINTVEERDSVAEPIPTGDDTPTDIETGNQEEDTRRVTIPGAVAVTPTRLESDEVEPHNDDPQEVMSVLDTSVTGLVQATLVSDEDNDKPDFAEAVPYRFLVKDALHNPRILALACLLVAVAIAGIMMAVFTAKSSSPVVPVLQDTPSPTVPPTLAQPIEELLPEFALENLDDPTSPQYRAHVWISNHPEYTSLPDWRKIQLFSLATFYFAFAGDEWPPEKRKNWLSYDTSLHECDSWGYYKLCDSKNGNENVTSLNLKDIALNEVPRERRWRERWTVPPEVSLLPSLQNLQITNAGVESFDISDLIPSQLTNLAQFTNLEIRGNYVRGTIPSTIARLTTLQHLFIAQMPKLSGTIPSEIGLLTNLKTLYLHEMNLKGTFPTEIGLLTNMLAIIMMRNQLSGTIPIELVGLKKMHQISMQKNAFTGTIMTEFGLMEKLNTISFNTNYLSGSLPTELGRMNLHYLDFDSNRLSGSIPTEFGLLADLEILELWNNGLVGTLPSEIGSMSRLMSFQVHENFLSGTLPQELCQLSNLEGLYLSDNAFNGTISEEIGNLSLLKSWFLADNQLSGTIPPAAGLLRSLQVWDLSGNGGLTGTLPDDLELLRQLEELLISGTSITGTIPQRLCSESTTFVIANNCSEAFVRCPQDCNCECDS